MDEQHAREVALGLRHGKTESWRMLYEAYARRVWQYVARWLGPRAADVADVVQEIFLAAARSASQFDADRGTLWNWLSGIAHHHVMLHFRKQRRREAVLPIERWLAQGDGRLLRWLNHRESPPDEALAASELATLVRETLAELPNEYGRLLAARYLDGAHVEELSAGEQSTVAAVRSKLARARRAFREVFTTRHAHARPHHAQ